MTLRYPMMAGIVLLGLVPAMAGAESDAGSAAVTIQLDEISPAPVDRAEGPSPFASAAVIDDSALAGVTGMADVSVLNQNINAQNTGNVANNTINGDSTTGMILIDGGSFQNFSGLGLINANTGNNVSINASMNVNVAIRN